MCHECYYICTIIIIWSKLYIPSTINVWKKVFTKAIWADKKWAAFWQISLYLHQVKLKYFTAHTINWECHSRQSVFRVLVIYNFVCICLASSLIDSRVEYWHEGNLTPLRVIISQDCFSKILMIWRKMKMML